MNDGMQMVKDAIRIVALCAIPAVASRWRLIRKVVLSMSTTPSTATVHSHLNAQALSRQDH